MTGHPQIVFDNVKLRKSKRTFYNTRPSLVWFVKWKRKEVQRVSED